MFFFNLKSTLFEDDYLIFLCEINFSCLHSRSPSMTSNSNRDSMISNASNSSNVDVPPSLPPKRDMYSNGGADTFSLTNFGDTSSNNSGSQEEIYNLRKLTKKKGPPPPPPIIDETEVTPTPPRKPALRPPT